MPRDLFTFHAAYASGDFRYFSAIQLELANLFIQLFARHCAFGLKFFRHMFSPLRLVWLFQGAALAN